MSRVIFSYIRKVLFKLAGLKNYLMILSRSFYPVFRAGLLRRDPVYAYHHFVKHLIRPGDCILDLGANLGYYGQIFARLTGPTGRVICIEPIPLFSKVAARSLASHSNCEVHNVAFGLEEKTIHLQVPIEKGILLPGHANIAEKDPSKQNELSFEAKMVCGSRYLEFLPKLDYIKCDIEGYEEVVLPELKPLFERFRPLLQVETWGSHQQKVISFLQGMGYERYVVSNGVLQKNQTDPQHFYEFLFVPREKEADVVKRVG